MSKDFPLVPLGEVLIPVSRPERVVPDKIYSILGAHWYGQGLYTKDVRTGVSIQAETVYKVEAGDFVYNRLFAWKGSFALATRDNHNCYVSNEFPCFMPKQDRIDGHYLWRYFSQSAVWAEALGLSSGGTPTSRNRLKEDRLLAMTIPLPPLEEQRRIVACIEELAGKIEEARGLRRQAAAETEALVLASAITARVSVAERYGTIPISQCSLMSTGTTPPTHRSEYFGGSVRWYTPGDLGSTMTPSSSTKTISNVAVAEGKARLFEAGTVLLVAIGGSLGKVTLTNQTCSANQQITGIKFHGDILPEYGFWWMRSLYRELRASAPQATLPIINQRKIGEFGIATPSPDEQRRIVAHLDDLQAEVDALKALQSQTAAELDALLPSLLDKAFKGEL